MTPTPHGQVPEALRLAHIFDNPLPPEWPDMVAAAAELRRQHARIAELEAQIEALSGVQALSAAPAIKPLVWSDERGHTDKIRYITAKTAAGQFSVEWKGWKEEDGPCVYLNGDYIGVASNLGGAKQLAEQHIRELVANLLAASPTPPAEQQAQQEAQEPVAWLVTWVGGVHNYVQAHASELPAVDQGRRMAGTVTPLYTAPQPAPAPLSDDAKDAARWRMVVLIGNEVMLHPEKRTQAAAVKAYMDATHSGSDLTGAVDAALAAQGGKDA